MALGLDERLMAVLVCPADHASLSAGTASDPNAAVLTCAECGRSYPVRDGIPVLLLDADADADEAADADADEAADADADEAADSETS